MGKYKRNYDSGKPLAVELRKLVVPKLNTMVVQYEVDMSPVGHLPKFQEISVCIKVQ